MTITIQFSAPATINVGTEIQIRPNKSGWSLDADHLTGTIVPIDGFPQQKNVEVLIGKVTAVNGGHHTAQVDTGWVVCKQIATVSE